MYNGGGGSGAGGGDAEEGAAELARMRASALKHLVPLAAGMISRYLQLAVAAEHARNAATPAFMQAAVQFAPLTAAQRQAGADAWAAAPPPAPAPQPAPGFGYYPLPPADAAAAAAAAHPPASSQQLDVRELFRETAAYGPLVLVLLEGVLAWGDDQFAANLPWLYPLLTELVVAGNQEIRGLVAGVLRERLPPLLPAPLAQAIAAGDAATRGDGSAENAAESSVA
jgi:hypothetical protein